MGDGFRLVVGRDRFNRNSVGPAEVAGAPATGPARL